MKLLWRLLMRIGLVFSGPSVSSVSSATQTEGTSLVHTVTLASPVTGTPGLYPFGIGGTASTPSDYTATPTFSNGVTLSGATLTVPLAVSSFTITVATSQDTVYEGAETYSVTVGGMTNTGTINDDDAAPTITSVSSASASEGASIVHTVAITGTAQAARTFAITLSGGTATGGGTDYTSTLTNGAFSAGVTISGGNISVPPGVTGFTVSVPTATDALTEGDETYTLNVGGASGVGTIVDVVAGAHFYLNLSNPGNATISDSQGVGTLLPQDDFYLNLSNPVNATIGDAQGVGTITGGGGGLISTSIATNRITGVAPLYVNFDASGTTAASLTSQPFHDLEYEWDFDDVSAGNWANGALSEFGLTWSKNQDFGPIAAHVFETPGTYTVALNARHDAISATAQTVTITVTDPNTVFSGANTVCIANGTLPVAGVNGVPAGATCVNTSDADAEIATQLAAGRKRILFKRGDSFNVSSNCAIDLDGPGIIGAYGTGNRPIFTATAECSTIAFSSYASVGKSDWRICDLDIDCGSFANGVGVYFGGTMDEVLCSKVRVTNAKYGVLSSSGNISPSVGHMWDVQGFYECDIYNSIGSTSSGANGMLLSAERLMVMGCRVDPNNGGEHAIRSSFSNRAVFSHNSLRGVPVSKAFLSIRAPLLFGNDPGVVAPFFDGEYAWIEKIIAQDNYCDPVGISGQYTTLGCGPVNGADGIGRARDLIFERNYMIEGQISPTGLRVSVRNNITTKSRNESYFDTGVLARTPEAEDVWVYNNTMYYSGASSCQLLFITGGPTSMTGGMTFRNNLVYSPNSSDGGYSDLIMTAFDVIYSITKSNNTSIGQRIVDPLFTATPPVAPANWRPTVGSYAIAGGTAVPVWSDFFGATVTGVSRTMGAVKN